MPFLTYKLNTICNTPVYHPFSIFHDFDHRAVNISNRSTVYSQDPGTARDPADGFGVNTFTHLAYILSVRLVSADGSHTNAGFLPATQSISLTGISTPWRDIERRLASLRDSRATCISNNAGIRFTSWKAKAHTARSVSLIHSTCSHVLCRC